MRTRSFFSVICFFVAACSGNETVSETATPTSGNTVAAEEAALPVDLEEPMAEQDLGLIRTQSAQGFSETVTALEAAVTSRGLRVIATVPHSQAAEANGLSLRPTTLVLFGKPQVGSPLMAAAPSLALDLPQRAAVYEEDGTVWVVHNDPAFLARRHGLEGHEDAIGRVTGALSAIVGEATATAAAE